MPVNTAALKTFAPAMRRQLLEAVGRKLDLLLNSQTPDTLSTYAKQIAELGEQEEENREQLLERVAYTWFNRLCALRYLDARAWHPFGCKVLMPAAEGETQPELLKLMRAGNLPAALQGHTDQDRLHGLLDGQIQTAIAGADPQGEVYRQLVLAVCRCYHELLPNLFEGLDDASELLLPDDLMSDGSIVGAFRKEINDEDCQDVESLGWLYQFYIAEKKDEVMARKKAVPTEDIPAVTQLFTPHWIVRYLVENSLGRLWLLNRPGSKLRDQMPYYIESDAETDFLVINKPEEIKLLDPACGSGHMLTYAFDLLSHIYAEEGYSASEIPGLILQHNLYGLEICPRAAQLAQLALVFKAREQSRRFFQPDQLVRPQVIELQDIRFEEGELNDYIDALDLGELFDPNLFKLLRQFEEAKNFGSLIQPCLDERAIADVRRAIEAKDLGGQLFLRETQLKVLRVLEQAEALTQRYHVVVANPPYLGLRKMNEVVKKAASGRLEEFKWDLYSCFLGRSLNWLKTNGFSGFMTPNTWMHVAAHEPTREHIRSYYQLNTLLEMNPGAFDGAAVQICAFSLEKRTQLNVKTKFLDLRSIKSSKVLAGNSFDQLIGKGLVKVFLKSMESMKKIPGGRLAYSSEQEVIEAFEKFPSIGDTITIKQGLVTSDNERFLRLWHEVSQRKADHECSNATDLANSTKKWFPFNKGGGSLKWYGNNEYYVNWENDGREMKEFTATLPQGTWVRLKSRDFYCLPSITFSRISLGSGFSCRVSEPGFIFDTNGSCAFSTDEDLIFFAGLLNSSTASHFLEVLCATLTNDLAGIRSIPRIPYSEDISRASQACIDFSRRMWDESETSWGFEGIGLLNLAAPATLLSEAIRLWLESKNTHLTSLQEAEAELNSLVAAGYGLAQKNVEDIQDSRNDIIQLDFNVAAIRLLSYMIGCIMGRYSLDHPGLILANAGDTLENYNAKVGKSSGEVTFQPDNDGIIPVLDGEWFEDDIVARTREFLAVTFPESSVAENLRFIEESLGKDIRKYFCSDFYKDHLQTYKKRPIYWMVQSPKKGFACLIYMHRYTKDTLNQVLNNYFRPYLQKLEARLAQLGLDQLNDDLPTRERTAARKEAEKITKVLKECEAWEQDALLPLAQQRIELDLDDGVKVNYLKLQDVLAPIPGLAAKED